MENFLQVLLSIVLVLFACYCVYRVVKVIWGLVKLFAIFSLYAFPVAITIVLAMIHPLLTIPCILLGIGYYILLVKITRVFVDRKTEPQV